MYNRTIKDVIDLPVRWLKDIIWFSFYSSLS